MYFDVIPPIQHEQMKYLLTILLLGSFTTMATAQTKDEAAVAGAVEALKKAMIDADKTGLEKLTAEKLSYGHSSGRIEDKATFIQNLVTGQSDFVNMDLTDQTIAVTGQTAIVRHTLSADTSDGGKAGKVRLYVMLVWNRQGGQWKLVGRQAVKIPQP